MTNRAAGFIMLALLLSGCTDVGLATANLMARAAGQEKTSDVAYGSRSHQKLDIYAPTEPGAARPVIVFFYGGSWKSGSKDIYRFAAEPFTSRGYVVVIPDYAKYPDYRYPTFAEDGALAVTWVQQHIADYGGDPKKLFITGHSAGAHLGALLVTDAHYLKQAGGSRRGILGFAGLAGPYDFVPDDPDIVAVFSPVGDDLDQAMPAAHIDGKQPPMLLLHGLADDVVAMRNIHGMQRQVTKHGGKLVVTTYEGVGHIGILAALSKPLRFKAPAVDDMTAFFAENLGK